MLPHHLVKAGMHEEARNVLCNLDFIEAKCSLGLIFDLVPGMCTKKKVLN